MNTNPHVVGVDPSITATALATPDGWTTLIGRPGITTLTAVEQEQALSDLADQIFDQVYPKRPALIVMERVETSHRYGGLAERVGLYWMLLRRFRGYTPVAVVTPAGRMKYATGKGAASKGAVIDAVARRLPQFETRGDDNRADAAILCAMGRDWLGAPLCDMPKTHRDALGTAQWPAMEGTQADV